MSNTATFNTSPNLKLSKKLSFGEEVANSVTHAVGAVAMLVYKLCSVLVQRTTPDL